MLVLLWVTPVLAQEKTPHDLKRRLVTDHLNRVTSPSREVVTCFVYDRVDNLLEEHLPNGNVVVHSYDALSRLTSTADVLGPVLSRGYDAQSHVIFEADGEGNETLSTWDALDRLIHQNLPEERVVHFTYDLAGNLTSQTNGRGFTTTAIYDELDRLVEVIDAEPFSNSVTATSDLADNLLSVTDRRSHTTNLEYDDLDRVLRRLEPPLSDGTRLAVEVGYDAAATS